MKKLLIFAFFIPFIFKNTFANEIKIVAWVNDEIITSKDIYNQIDIKKNILNKIIYKINYQKEINLLVEKKLKIQEIKKKKISISENTLENYYKNFLSNNNANTDFLKKNNHLEMIIKEDIETELAWVELIKKNYSWKMSINLYEMENKLDSLTQNLSEKEKNKLEKKLLIDETNKKFQAFSNLHLAQLQNKAYIKINEK